MFTIIIVGNYRQFKCLACGMANKVHQKKDYIIRPQKCAFREYLKIVDVKDPIVCKCIEKRKYTTVLMFASRWCELQVNYFLIFLFG